MNKSYARPISLSRFGEEVPAVPRDDDKRNIKQDYNMYTWSGYSRATFLINAYTIQKYIKAIADEVLNYEVKATEEFEYSYKQQELIVVYGQLIFTYQNKLYLLNINCESHTVTLNSNNDISVLVDSIKEEIKYRNPIRNKHLQIIPGGDGLAYLFKNPPTVTFDNIIMDDKIKEDIYDNTIFHLENLDDNNGIILYGVPGTGKSAICQAIINEAIKKKYSTCFVVSRVYYTALSEFINNFLAPCILIFEDIDSFGQDRRDMPDNGGLADFLQFMSGLYERDDKIVVIATTNYIEHLDSAISNRPCRFNRKYEFKLPTNSEVNKMLDLYFGDGILSESLKKLCYGKSLTGSHIKELQRTAMLLSKKRGADVVNVFNDAVDIVGNNFSVAGEKSVSFGFGK